MQELLAEYGNVKMLGGQRTVVRNDYGTKYPKATDKLAKDAPRCLPFR